MKQTRLWLAMIVTLLCSLTVNAHDFEVDGIYYSITSETDLTVGVTHRGIRHNDYYDEYSGEITIPSTVIYDNKTYSVTSIERQAFHSCWSLSSISIPKEITYIDAYTFYDCSGLISIVIPVDSKLEIIGSGAFSGCGALKSIILPEGVTKISDEAFKNCSSLTTVTIPKSLTYIGNYAFYGCYKLIDVHIGSIASWLNIKFGYESAHPNYAGSVNMYMDGELLTEVDIPSTIESIPDYAFQGCGSITSINIPESVTSIGYKAFYGCSSLTSVSFPKNSNLTCVEDDAFYNCSSLTSVSIPQSVNDIGESAFYGCSSLASVILPESITNIKDYTFYGCNSLASINIPMNVEWIGNYAFTGCGSLTDIQIGSVESWLKIRYVSDAISYPENYSSHPNCSNMNLYIGDMLLTEVDIPSTITTIPNYAFYGCSNITSVNIPESVTSIGVRAFKNCTSLVSVNIPENSKLANIGKETFYSCSGLTSIYIPEGVTSVEELMFSSCSSLTSVVLPEGITDIGEQAFSGCSSLTSITIPDSVTDIGKMAFYDCSNLTTVNISGNSKLTCISDYAFSYCSNLTSFTIPQNIDRIGTYAFRDCSRICTIINYSDKYISAGSHNYGDLSFYAKRVLNGNSLITVGDFQFYTSGNAHYLANYIGCAENIVLPDNYNGENYRIDDYTFYNNNIKSLTISSSVLSIGEKACNSPRKVIWLTNTPPSGYTNAQGSINYVSNEQYTNLGNAKVYPYLSSMFEMDGVKYVPVSPSERTCHAIDCAYDSTAAVVRVGETASFKGVAMKVAEIMPYTFYGNDHIKEVSVSHAGDVGYYAFYDCDSVQRVVVANQGNIGDQAFYDCDGVQSVVVSNHGDIGSQAFYDCDEIVTVNVSNQGYIYSQAFYGCDRLKRMDISIKGTIRAEAFSSCPMLAEVILHDGITGILDEAFASCQSLEYIEIPSTVSYIGKKVFYDCDSLASIVVADGNATYDSRDNCNAIIKRSDNKLIVGCNATVIPESVTAIGNYAFCGCGELTHVALSENIQTLDDYAFMDCTGLKEIIIPKAISVGVGCFSDCSSLTSVTIGDGVKTISNGAFGDCTSLAEIRIPHGVTEIGNTVFSGCKSLANVIIEDRVQALTLGSNGYLALFANCPLDSVYIGGKISYNTSSSKGYSPFYRNTSLRTVVISDREELIHDNEFYGCTNLQNVTVGNGVSRIGNYAFSGCSNLDDFSFGSNMESVGTEAFSDCTNLTTITSHAIVPPTCSAQALDDVNKWSCVLRVPSGYADAYQTAGQWKEFLFVEDVVEVKKYALTYMVDGELYYTDTLAHKASISTVAKPMKEGYTFSGWDRVLTKMLAEDVVINGTFTINTYKVKYIVDGTVYRTDEVTYGDSIVVAEEPVKDGYTFSGWSEAPEVMPAYNITVRGDFIANKYLVTFKIGDEIIISDSLECGSTIVVPEAPVKEGYTFNGWGEVAETVPAHDLTYEGNYSINSYLLTYVVDGETVQTDSLTYGTAITLLDEPVKEGYTFSGWSEAPETMPASNVVISGTFTINKYLVTFKVGDEVIAADSLEYGAMIVAPEAPEKEGHTFNGWGEVVETVPASDLTYEGSYSVNSYLLSYVVDGETVQADSIAYGTAITLLEEPTKEGYTFNGWSEAPETMPAEDVTISGTFTVNTYKVYYYVGEELVHTAEVAYGEAIPEYVYEPTAEGDVFQGWSGETYETMPAHDVIYTANITNGIDAMSTDNGQQTTVIYDLNGRKVTVTENLKGGIYIVNGRKMVVR